MKRKIIAILQIVANLICAPLYFLKLFVGVGHLPDQNGNIVETHFYHTPYENLTDMSASWLLYISLAMIAVSITLSVLGLIKSENKKLKNTSFIVSVCSVVFAAIVILIASTVARGY